MTGPNNPPPPGGPGRYFYQPTTADVLAVLDEVDAWAEKVAAGAPPLTAETRAQLERLFAGGASAR
jgi:hypothetical protein